MIFYAHIPESLCTQTVRGSQALTTRLGCRVFFVLVTHRTLTSAEIVGNVMSSGAIIKPEELLSLTLYAGVLTRSLSSAHCQFTIILMGLFKACAQIDAEYLCVQHINKMTDDFSHLT